MTSVTIAEEYLSVPKAARLLDMDGGELYRMILRGELEAMPTLEHGVLIPAQEVQRLLRQRQEAEAEG